LRQKHCEDISFLSIGDLIGEENLLFSKPNSVEVIVDSKEAEFYWISIKDFMKKFYSLMPEMKKIFKQ
jgi:hypothetical protein